MKDETITLKNFTLPYDMSSIIDIDNSLFIDIETTGLTPRTSHIYMIGLAYYEKDTWYFRGLFADTQSEEESVLLSLVSALDNYTTLVHFNGTTFDIPFINKRFGKYNISYDFKALKSLDLCREFSPYKFIFNMPNCKQKTVETVLGINREDIYSGGELIEVYKQYVKSPDEATYRLLYTHNHDDVIGMLKITAFYSLIDVINGSYNAVNAYINEYNDINGIKKEELFINFLGIPINIPINCHAYGYNLKLKDGKGMLRCPIENGSLKLYYSDYKNYYYLPAEDMAVHKSVGQYVDKNYREKATATNCYTRFIPDENFLNNKDKLSTYVSSVINMLKNGR